MRRSHITASIASSSPTARGGDHAVRWSLLPAAQPVPVSQAELEKRGPDFLEQEIRETGAYGRCAALDHGGDGGRSRATPRPIPARLGRKAVAPFRLGRWWCSGSNPSGMAHAATSISIRLSCRRASGCRTTRSRPRAHRSTANPMTCARPKPRTIREPRQPGHDRPSSPFQPASAPAALADGCLHHRHALHRCRHGIHHHAEIPAAHPRPQDAGRRSAGARTDPAGAAAVLRCSAAAGRSAEGHETRQRNCLTMRCTAS